MKSLISVALCVCTSVIVFGATPEVPFTIVENRGQAEANTQLVGQGPGIRVDFMDRGLRLGTADAAVTMNFIDADPGTKALPEAASGATINYLSGSDPAHWRRNLTAFGAARYAHLWPGVDLVFRAKGAGPHAEFHLGPGASAGSVQLQFSGTPEKTRNGGLVIQTDNGEIRLPPPEVFSDSGVNSLPVPAEYLIRGGDTVGLSLRTVLSPAAIAVPLAAGSRNPSLLFSGYFGGTTQDNITAVAITTSFNIVVAGWTASTDLPANGVRHTTGGGVDAFVANFSPVNGQLVYCTYLGGSGDDRAFGIAVDQSQNTYITGYTSSGNFPVVGGVQSKLSGARDAFVTKLNPTGTAIIYSTYLGGSGVDSAAAIAVDSAGSAVIVGDTTSGNLATTTGAFQRQLAGGQDVFAARLNAAGNQLVGLTLLGGAAADHAAGVGLDNTGNIAIAGSTFSLNFPTASALQPASGGGQDGFVTKLSSDCKTLLWSTYLGGSGGSPGAPEIANAVTVHPLSGNVTVVGTTSSSDFPTTSGAFQRTFGGGQIDGFFTRLSAGGVLVASTYIGGSGDDAVNGVASDLRGLQYMTGYTSSSDFPIYRGAQSAPAGGLDAFVMKFQTMSLIYSTYIGGSGADSANAIAVDSLSSVVVAGSTGSSNLPVSGSLAHYKPGVLSGFVTKIAPTWSLAITSTPTIYYDPWHINGYNGSTQIVSSGTYGQAGDINIAGDWDGSGVKRIGVFRNGLWILDTNGNGVLDAGDKTVTFGQAGDKPITGYFDGTGRPQLGLFRNGSFILDLSGHLTGVATGNADATFTFGQAGDTPVSGDWNGSGTTKVGVYRNGLWLLDYNGDRIFDGSDRTYTFGQSGDIPVTGDWDSSGRATRIGIYRFGFWLLDYDGDGALTNPGGLDMYFAFGGGAFKPLVF